MQEQKHIEALKEVMETIETSLKDQRGLVSWQRRLASMMSLGCQHLIEVYLHRKDAIKPSAQIKHEWLKMERKNIKQRLSSVTTKSIENLSDSGEILEIARTIELVRNDLVYGPDLKKDDILKEKISDFLELKKIIEKNVGDII